MLAANKLIVLLYKKSGTEQALAIKKIMKISKVTKMVYPKNAADDR